MAGPRDEPVPVPPQSQPPPPARGSRIVLASANPGKLREFAELLAPTGLVIESLSALGIESPEETGSTFEANALLKARHAALRSGLPALADDSGLEVDALGGAPGVRSARYAGPDATDARNIAQLLAALEAVPDAARGARFRCVIAFVRGPDDPAPLLARGAWEGRILRAPRGSRGFGYDPVFAPLASAISVAEMPSDAKHAASHRGAALRELLRLLQAQAASPGATPGASSGASAAVTPDATPSAPSAHP
jgi:XTP/dITP diphosphohydrolase